MAQADYIISNQTFPNTRADINSTLQAIATTNSGTSAPTTQYAGQFWIDTTSSTWTLYIHDGSDDIQFATIDTSANTVNFIDSALASDVVINTSGNITTTGAFTSVGIDDNATSTAITIDSSERVGIGTTSPGRKVTIYDSSSPYLALQNSTSGTTNSDGMLIGIGGSNAFIINYENQPLTFSTNALERMRIDSDGDVLIAKSANSLGAVGIELKGETDVSKGRIRGTTSGSVCIELNRLTSDGEIAKFYKDTTAVGSIASGASDTLIIGTDTCGIRFYDISNVVQPRNTNGSTSDNTISLGMVNNRFKDVVLGGGVYLGGTGTANKLEDYEEGTFTPEFSSSGATLTYSVRQGYYTKIGNTVIYSLYIQLDGTPFTTTANAVTITGLPFTSTSGYAHSSSSIAGVRLVNFDSGYYQLEGRIGTSTTSINLFENGDNVSADQLRSNQLSNVSGQVFLSGSYKTDA